MNKPQSKTTKPDFDVNRDPGDEREEASEMVRRLREQFDLDALKRALDDLDEDA